VGSAGFTGWLVSFFGTGTGLAKVGPLGKGSSGREPR
jgi:hypothetical protein